jgi:hypothetical protein
MSPLAARRPRSIVLAALSIALGAWSLAGFAEDRAVRESSERFTRHFTLDRRRPLEVAALALERSADGAAAIAVDAALEDVRGQGPPADLGPELREAWLQSARSIGEELEAARVLALDAASGRPGRAQHRFLLGQVVHAAHVRTRAATSNARQWIVPLSLAGSAAPGLDPIFTFLGGAYLDNWGQLTADDRASAAVALQRAFFDPGFVSRSVLAASAAIGRDEALRLLPDEAEPLRAASRAFAGTGDAGTASELRPRLDRAIRRQRDLGIERIAQRRAAGDLEGARAACLAWIERSSGSEFDDALGRAQAARVLELWPNDVVGAWRTDPRGELVRFFLARREGDVRPDALRRTTEALTGVPDTVRARIRLLAGDPSGAEEIRRKSGDPASFEWTPFLVEVARQRLAGGDPKAAREALRELSAAAAEGCDVLLARRDVAAALADKGEVATVEERLRRLHRDSIPPEAWSSGGSMSLCLDGGESGRKLRVAIEARNAAIVAYGWNGGRQGSVLVPRGASVLTVPFPALTGRQIFSLSSEAGGPIQPGAATLGSGG